MRSRRNTSEDAHALCYVWLTIALFIVSMVCFATASQSSYMAVAGVLSLCLAAMLATIYIVRYCATRQRNDPRGRCSSCCAIWWCMCCDDCCGGCCGRCCRFVLCLSNEGDTQTLSITRRDRERIRALQRAFGQSSSGVSNSTTTSSDEPSAHVVSVSEDGQTALIPAHSNSNTDTAASSEIKLQSLENEIKRLRHDYEFLQRQNCVDDDVQRDYEHLDSEEARLLTWQDNDVTPTQLELKAMKGRLKMVARNFRLVRARLFSQPAR